MCGEAWQVLRNPASWQIVGCELAFNPLKTCCMLILCSMYIFNLLETLKLFGSSFKSYINVDVINDFFNLKNIEEVNSYISVAREKEINGVPFFEIGTDFISGAQSSTSLESAIKSNLS